MKPVFLGVTGLLLLLLTAYLCGTLLGKKPFSWRNEPRLPQDQIHDALQGTWRSILVIIGPKAMRLKESFHSVKIDENDFYYLDGTGAPLPRLHNTMSLDATHDPVWFDMEHKATGQSFLGIIEINQDKNRVRLLMRLATSPLGRPNQFEVRDETDIYWEFTR